MKKINIEKRNEQYLIRFAGEKGAIKKCNLFKAIDGPNAEEIEDMLKVSDIKGESDEMYEMIERACMLVEEEIPNAEAQINKLSSCELDIENNRTLYNLTREAFQLSDERCKSVLITNIVTSKKKFMWKEIETIEKIEVLAFDIEGNMLQEDEERQLQGCSLDSPLEITLDSILALISFYDKNKKSVVKKDSKSRVINLPEHISGKKEDKDDFECGRDSLNKDTVKVGSILKNNKTALVIGVVGVAVIGVLSLRTAKLTVIAEKYDKVMNLLNDEARSNVEYTLEMEQAAEKLGMEFDLEKKAFVKVSSK